MAAPPDLERLWRTAHAVAARLKQEGCSSVAVSGSLARGDAGAGSDVDLWAIGPNGGRDERFVGGVPVTVFRDRAESLYDRAWTGRWDVDRLVVLFDAPGHFSSLARRWTKQSPRRRVEIEQITQRTIAQARQAMRTADPEARVLARHQVAWAGVALRLWRATGIRVPKWRHSKAVLSASAVERLRRDLDLPLSRADLSRLRGLVPLAPGLVSRFFRLHFDERAHVPRWAAAEHALKWSDPDEAVLKLRTEVERWIESPLRDRVPGVIVGDFLRRSRVPELATLFRLVNAL